MYMYADVLLGLYLYNQKMSLTNGDTGLNGNGDVETRISVMENDTDL